GGSASCGSASSRAGGPTTRGRASSTRRAGSRCTCTARCSCWTRSCTPCPPPSRAPCASTQHRPPVPHPHPALNLIFFVRKRPPPKKKKKKLKGKKRKKKEDFKKKKGKKRRGKKKKGKKRKGKKGKKTKGKKGKKKIKKKGQKRKEKKRKKKKGGKKERKIKKKKGKKGKKKKERKKEKNEGEKKRKKKKKKGKKKEKNRRKKKKTKRPQNALLLPGLWPQGGAPRTTFPSGPRGAGRKWPRERGADSISRRPLRAAAPPPFPVGPRGGGGAKMAAAGGGGPAARELFAEGLLQFLRPAVRQLDGHVHAVRESQVELREHIDSLATELCRINEDQKVALDLDPYVKKLLNARRRVVLVNNILQNAQERLRRLNHSVAKETVRRKALLEAAGGYPQGLPGK
uniref:Biogenesis of lysosome-related organelles complex 1 subunit 7 n=2 Tax=Anatidae TaxID=8830 RepID=A0A493U308_ANAPP